jgi:uracil-DNA glycosylase
VREVFGEADLPRQRVFFTEALLCPRQRKEPAPEEAVAQCASAHLQPLLAFPSIQVVLCLGDDAVLAVTGRYRWEPWRALHGRVVRRTGRPTLVMAVHPMAAREGGGEPWSRSVRSRLAALLRDELGSYGTSNRT